MTEYKCGICGSVYDSIEYRMNCELECLKAQKEQAAKMEAEKKAAEKEARFEEVSKAIDTAYDLLAKCIEDYGTYTYKGSIDNLDFNMLKNIEVKSYKYDDFFPSKLLHFFF